MAYVGVQRPVGMLVLILVFSELAIAAPVVVYDNTTTPTSGGYCAPDDGFWSFNRFLNDPIGDQITLAGTNRTVVKFDLVLSSSQPTSLSSLTLAFYASDPNTGYPGDYLWGDTANNVSVNGITTVTFNVPNVVVPDTFVWVAGADSTLAGLATYSPPMVGTSDNYYWSYSPTYDWWCPLYFEDDPVADFGAEVLAVPEPTILGLLALGGLLAACRKRRDNQAIKISGNRFANVGYPLS